MVLSRVAWKESLPRLPKRSLPRSHFKRLIIRSTEGRRVMMALKRLAIGGSLWSICLRVLKGTMMVLPFWLP